MMRCSACDGERELAVIATMAGSAALIEALKASEFASRTEMHA